MLSDLNDRIAANASAPSLTGYQSLVNDLWSALAIEAEARAAALTAVEEAVRSSIFDLPIGVNVDYSRGYSVAVSADRGAVLAVLAELKEENG